jgi:hypothetical protein
LITLVLIVTVLLVRSDAVLRSLRPAGILQERRPAGQL